MSLPCSIEPPLEGVLAFEPVLIDPMACRPRIVVPPIDIFVPPVTLPPILIDLPCSEFTVTSNVTVHPPPQITLPKPFTMEPIAGPDCGIIIDGEIEIDLCKDFLLTQSVNLHGVGYDSASLAFNKIADAHGKLCKLEVIGDLGLKVCDKLEVNVTTAITPGMTSNGFVLQSDTLSTKTGSTAPVTQDCGLTFGLELITELTDMAFTTSTLSGVTWDMKYPNLGLGIPLGYFQS